MSYPSTGGTEFPRREAPVLRGSCHITQGHCNLAKPSHPHHLLVVCLLDSMTLCRGRWESPERRPNIPVWEREQMNDITMCEVRKGVSFEAIELKPQRKVKGLGIWSACLRALLQPMAHQICSSIGSPRHMVILWYRHLAYFPEYVEWPKDDTVKCSLLNCLRPDGKQMHLKWFLNYYPL